MCCQNMDLEGEWPFDTKAHFLKKHVPFHLSFMEVFWQSWLARIALLFLVWLPPFWRHNMPRNELGILALELIKQLANEHDAEK